MGEFKGNLRNPDEERQRPAYFDEQVEIDVLAAMCEKQDLRYEALEKLEAEDFYYESHRNLFRLIASSPSRYERKNGTLDYEALMSEDRLLLDSVGGWFLAPKLVNHTQRIEAMRQMRLDRDLRLLLEQAEDEDNPGARREMLYRGLDEIDRGDETKSPGQVADSVMVELLHIASGEDMKGMLTGWPKIDRKIGGLRKGRSVVIALRPGGGKTAIATQVADRIAGRGHKVLILTTEMTAEQYLFRLAITHANITLADLENRSIVSEKLKAAKKYLDSWVSQDSLKIESKPRATPEDLRRYIHRHKPDLVVVDYLQRMRSSGSSEAGSNLKEYDEVSSISMDVDALKLSEDVAMLICAQLNREVEHRQSQRPKMSDLRNSGQIEQDADVILLGHQDDERKIMLHCAKHRHGEDNWHTPLWLAEGTLYITDQMPGRGAVWHEGSA